MAISKNTNGTPIIRHEIGDFLKVGEDFAPMTKFTKIDENPNAVTSETFYTADRSATTDTVGYNTKFSFSGIAHKNNDVTKFIRNIYQEQKTGKDAETEFIRVEYSRPIQSEDNTFYARKFTVAIEVSGESAAGGEKVMIEGSLNGKGTVIVGKFNTQLGEFTAGTFTEVAPVTLT